MPFEVVLAPQAVAGLKALSADFQSGLRDAIELHLRHQPTKLSKSRIKRLRGLDRPQYRLMVNEVRVFYDVTETTVEVLVIIPKEQVEAWLAEKAGPTSPGRLGRSEGRSLAVPEARGRSRDPDHPPRKTRRRVDRFRNRR